MTLPTSLVTLWLEVLLAWKKCGIKLFVKRRQRSDVLRLLSIQPLVFLPLIEELLDVPTNL